MYGTTSITRDNFPMNAPIVYTGDALPLQKKVYSPRRNREIRIHFATILSFYNN